MSSANLDLVRAIYAEWERGDWSSNWWADPEIETVIDTGLVKDVHHGLEGMAKGWGEFLGAWKDFSIVVEEYRELDDNRILVLVHNTGEGRHSGMDVESMGGKGANLFEIRGGKVVRLEAFASRKTGLEALGLD